MWNETHLPWMNLVTNKSKLSSPVMVWILLNTSSRASCDSSLESILCSFILHPWANKCHYHQHQTRDSHNILYIGDVRTQSSRAKIQPGFVASQAVRSFLWGKWEPFWRGWLNGREVTKPGSRHPCKWKLHILLISTGGLTLILNTALIALGGHELLEVAFVCDQPLQVLYLCLVLGEVLPCFLLQQDHLGLSFSPKLQE